MSTIKLENIQTRTGSGTITIGASGETVALGSGATQTGFGLSGWSEDGANNNLLPASASAGIYLGVNSATASNLLDDYEEGTWTPTIEAGISSPTYTLQEGGYVKIGKMVYFSFDIRTSGGTLVSGDFRCAGLPFVQDSGDQSNRGGHIVYGFDIVSSSGVPFPPIILSTGTPTINFYKTDGTRFNGTDLQNSSIVLVASGMYKTT